MWRRLSVGGVVVALGIALASWAAKGNTGAGTGSIITEDDFWAALQNNANLVGDCYATVDLNCSYDPFDFVDGFMAAKGTSKFHLNHGSRGTAIWHNDMAVNVFIPELGGRTGGINAQDPAADGVWFSEWGLADLRQVADFANDEPLSVASTTEQVNGAECFLLSNSKITLWVDVQQLHRIMRYELRYASGEVAFRGEYVGWAGYGAGGELPDTIFVENFYEDGSIATSWLYLLRNIEVQATINDSWFETWVPPNVPIPPRPI